MVQFGQQLVALAYAPWKEHYLDYQRLKRTLRQDLRLASDDSSSGSSTNNTTSSQEQSRPRDDDDNDNNDYDDPEHAGQPQQFVPLLHGEIVRCALFFLQQQGTLATQLRTAVPQQQRRLAFHIWEWHDCCFVPRHNVAIGGNNSGSVDDNDNDDDMDDDDDDDEERQQRRLELWTQLQAFALELE